MAPRSPQTSPVAALSAFLLLGGCASAPVPLIQPPDLQVEVRQFSGGVLAGVEVPTTIPDADGGSGADRVALDEIVGVTLRAYLVQPEVLVEEELGATGGPSQQAVLLLAPDTDQPIRGRAPALREVQMSFGAAAEQRLAIAEKAATDPRLAIRFADESGLLYRDVIARFDWTPPAGGASRELALSLSEGGDVRVVLGERLDGETVVAAIAQSLDPDVRSGDGAESGRPSTLWLQWPYARPGEARTQVLGVGIRVQAAATLDRIAISRLFRRVESEVAQASRRAAREVATLGGVEAKTRRLQVAWAALDDAASRRSALVALVDPERSPAESVALDYAVTAEDGVLAEWHEQLAGLDVVPDDAVMMGWCVARAGIRVLGSRVDRDAAQDFEVGALLRAFGEAGRFPSDLVRAAAGSKDAATFRDWVVAENRRLLGSSDPAARVRALDWLRDRGAAPAEFDPFSSRDERRAALKRDEKARETASSQQIEDER